MPIYKMSMEFWYYYTSTLLLNTINLPKTLTLSNYFSLFEAHMQNQYWWFIAAALFSVRYHYFAFILHSTLVLQNVVYALKTAKGYEKRGLAMLSLTMLIYDTITKRAVKLFIHVSTIPYTKRYRIQYSVFCRVKTSLTYP